MTPNRHVLLVLAVVGFTSLLAAPSFAQAPAGQPEQVSYLNPRDSTELTALLSRPAGEGPHGAVVLLSIAGTNPIVERLVAEGYVVLTPGLRGFARVEPLLQATFAQLAEDVTAAVSYLRSLEGIDENALAVVAQGDYAPQAMLAAAGPEASLPLVLLAPPAFSGAESFRLEQRWVAENQQVPPAELQALDAYVQEIADIVRDPVAPLDREYRLANLRARSDVELPRNASFPEDERQMHFFASPLWHDKMAFEPEVTLGRLTAPALVLIGTEDPGTPWDAYLAAIRRGLADAPTPDKTVCALPGRTSHSFSEVAVNTIVEWLEPRMESGGGRAAPAAASLSGCLDDDEIG